MRSAVQSCVPLLENQALTKLSWVLFSFLGTLREHKLFYFSLYAEKFLTAFIQLIKIYKQEEDWYSDGVQRSGTEAE